LSQNKIWFSFFDGAKYTGSENSFYDVKDQSWVKHLESNSGIIKEELLHLAQNEKGLVPYFNATLASSALQWKVFPFKLWGKNYSKNISKCIKTAGLLESCPDLLSASFSILDANTDIKAHYGDTNAAYRCHLGLIIPAGLPQCGLEVNGKQSGWEEGKIVAFCDAHLHRAWNYSSEKRAVLVFDVLRPEFVRQKKQILARAKVSLFWLHLLQNTSLVNKLPFGIKKLMVKIPAFFISPFLQ